LQEIRPSLHHPIGTTWKQQLAVLMGWQTWHQMTSACNRFNEVRIICLDNIDYLLSLVLQTFKRAWLQFHEQF